MTYPRETWYLRLGLVLINALQQVRGDPFRSFMHPAAEMDKLLMDSGMVRVFLKRLFVWELTVYTRICTTGRKS